MDELIDLFSGTHTWDPVDNLTQLRESLSETERILANHDEFAAMSHAPTVIKRYQYMLRMTQSIDVEPTMSEHTVLETINDIVNMSLERPMLILMASVEVDRHLLEMFE